MFSSSAGSLCSNKNCDDYKKVEEDFFKKSQNELTFGELGSTEVDKD